MDIGGINRIKPMTTTVSTELRKNNQSSTDRDAQGHNGYDRQKKATQLTPEQEQEALAALNALPSFVKLGLRGELVREAGKAAHIVVRDPQGALVRHIPYSEIIELYVNRKSGSEKGQLLKKAA